MKNTNLHAAKVNKNDEFYTRIEDIARELYNYKCHFKDKTVYCNCDDAQSMRICRCYVKTAIAKKEQYNPHSGYIIKGV